MFAQSKQGPVLIGWLHTGSRESFAHLFAAFTDGLAALGWRRGTEIVIEERWADGRNDRLPPFAAELAAKRPAVIVTVGAHALAAAAKAAPKTPIVVAAGDPLAAGLVSNLARPGGMITGVTNIVAQVSEKHLELLLDADPRLRRIGFLGDPNNPAGPALLDTARRSIAGRPVEARFEEAAGPEDIEPAMSRLGKQGAQALIVMGSPLFVTERRRIVKLALARRWPVVAGLTEWAEEGALLSYGTDRPALHRRAAWYVDRILKGAKPGDLPIEQPTKFDLVVNMKTARTLGITIPQSILVRADRVIE